ncbi:Basic form of pathogenesis-related protein 1 [Morella rubra]|uniref:Basic form of pathogenesis-related protein 1 n=1 Tax=Morella rubra TaxID=262757 RepID=A0A6A1WPW7_9ROSI|nr:Basic form of pathogenesis-related protein 1 [Morella rubra]
MGFNKFLLAVCFLGLTTYVSLAQNSHRDFLAAHNAARAKVGVGPMTWNHTLQVYARNYARQRIEDCNMEHSMGPYGENLAEGEKPNYDYNSNKCVGGECLHYTQVVWRDSVHLGCNRAKCKNGWIFVICNYSPPGNYEGQRPY